MTLPHQMHRPRNADSKGCLQESKSKLASAENETEKQLRVFPQRAEKHLCCSQLSGFFGVSELIGKESGCKGATYVLYVALNGEKISCLQSARTTSFD
jgi:hypothetical protein